MRYCSRCGNQLSDDMIYCPKCGHKEPLDKDDKPVVIHTFDHQPKTNTINQTPTSFSSQNSNPVSQTEDKKTKILVKITNIIHFCALVLSIVLIPFSIIGTSSKDSESYLPSIIIASVIIFLTVITLTLNVCLYIKQRKTNKGVKNTMLTSIIINCVCTVIAIIQVVLLTAVKIGAFSIFMFGLLITNLMLGVVSKKRKPKQIPKPEESVKK